MRHLQKILLIVIAVFGSSLVLAAPPVTKYEYDAVGNPTKTTDNSLNTSYIEQYDTVNRPIVLSEPHPTNPNTQQGQISTQYNALDIVTNVTDPRSLSTAYTKNAFGETLSLASPDTGTSSSAYDNAGNLLTRTDARGAVATYTYDALNRAAGATFKPSAAGSFDETIVFTYDGGTNQKGKLTSMTDLSGNTVWNYDLQGRMTRQQQTTNSKLFDLQLQYDSAGRLTRRTYPSSRYVEYSYNGNGQVNQISVNGTVMISNIQYHATGSIKGWTWGNNQTYQRSIDSSGRTATYTVGDKVQVVTYDNTGRIIQLHRALTTSPNTPIANTISTYVYDNLDRLTNNVTPTTNTGYQYDLSGNRTNLTVGANSYAYTIAATNNRLTAEAGPTARTNTYDAAGNITGNGQDTYAYSSRGRLKEVTRNSNVIYALRYNGLGQFVHRTHDNTYYVYDDNQHLLGEYDSSGQAIQETVYLNDTPVLTLKTNNATLQDNTYFIYSDYLNTPREIRDYANQARWTWYPESSEAFGANLPNENPSALGTFTYNLRFPGQLYDPASQLSYNYYRDYNSRTGRYIESDPIGLAGGINTYSYVGGNPISRVDPDGQFFFLPIVAALAESGAGAWAGAGALGVGGAAWWGLQHPPKPSAGNSSSDSPFANSGADSGNSSSSSDSGSNSCSSPPPDKKHCEALRQSILNTCYGLTGNKRKRCFIAADISYNQCMGYE